MLKGLCKITAVLALLAVAVLYVLYKAEVIFGPDSALEED